MILVPVMIKVMLWREIGILNICIRRNAPNLTKIKQNNRNNTKKVKKRGINVAVKMGVSIGIDSDFNLEFVGI